MEHLIKRSDLMAQFGQGPVYLHTDERRNNKVQGLNSDRLKFRDAPLCQHCNSTRTQPHDLAWQRLSGYIGTMGDAFTPGGRIDLEQVFPGRVQTSLRHVQLYFVKQFGCRVASSDIPVELNPLAEAIISDSTQPHIWLELIACRQEWQDWAGLTDIQTIFNQGRVTAANYAYHLGRLAVGIHYIVGKPTEQERCCGYWHAASVHRFLPIVDRVAAEDNAFS